MKYNLGCGDEHLEGFVNVDYSVKCQPDIVADIRKLPWDWCEDADRIEMDNLLEHIEAELAIKVVNECHRVLKPGGQLWIRVPEVRPDNLLPCFTDPTHVNYFTDQTFGYFEKGHVRHDRFGKDYGIVGWSKRTQIRNGIFIEATLIK
jgi:SAM-dependent methyltransferase